MDPILARSLAALAAGLALLAVGYFLDPVRVARQWWRNR